MAIHQTGGACARRNAVVLLLATTAFLLCAAVSAHSYDGHYMAERFCSNVLLLKTTTRTGTNESIEYGFGFVIGERGGNVLAVTAWHVIECNDSECTPEVDARFYGTPQWVEAQCLDFSPKDTLDLALLSVPKPAGHKLVVGCIDDRDLAKERETDVWFVGEGQEWDIPALGHPGTIEEANDLNTHWIAKYLSVEPGTSGAPLISAHGIVGMIQTSTASDTPQALKIELIQRWVRKNFTDAWNLMSDCVLGTPLSPDNDEDEVPVDSEFEIAFSGSIQVASGEIVLWDLDSEQIISSIPVPSAEVSVQGHSVIIDSAGDLPFGTRIAVLIDDDAFTAPDGKSFVGVTTNSAWRFTTVDEPIAEPPKPSALDSRVVPVGEAGTFYEDAQIGASSGTLYLAVLDNPSSWNPITSYAAASLGGSTAGITDLMFTGLLCVDPLTGALIPDLAESYELSEDGLVLTFHLREGLQWSDGAPITADDVVFTYNDVVLNEDIDCGMRDGLVLPDGTYPVCEEVDAHTVRFTLSTIFRPILHALTAKILPAHKLAGSVHKLNPSVRAGTFNETWTLDTPLDELVGNGPWIVTDYLPDQSVMMERNRYYHVYDPAGTQLPYYDTVILSIFAYEDVVLLKYRNGEIDAYAPRSIDVPLLKAEGAQKGFTVLLLDVQGLGTSWVYFNQDIGLADGIDENKRSLFRTLEFRQAFAQSIDKQAIIDTLYNGLAFPMWSSISIASPFYAGRDVYGGPITENDAVVWEYDPGAANAALDRLGIVDRDGDGWRDYEDGTRVEIELNTASGRTTFEGMCMIIADGCQQAGLYVEFTPIDFNTLVNKLIGCKTDMALLGLTDSADPNGGVSVYEKCGSLHFWRYSDCEDPTQVAERMTELYRDGTWTFDLDEAFEIYKEAQILDATDAGLVRLVCPLFGYCYYNHVGNAHLVSPNGVGLNGLGRVMELFFDRR